MWVFFPHVNTESKGKAVVIWEHKLKEKIEKTFSWRVSYNPLTPMQTLSHDINSKLRGWEVEREKITDHTHNSVPKDINTNAICSHVLKC